MLNTASGKYDELIQKEISEELKKLCYQIIQLVSYYYFYYFYNYYY
jgi:hypothetical protein